MIIELMTPIITSKVISTIIHLFWVLWSTSVTSPDSAFKYIRHEKNLASSRSNPVTLNKGISYSKLF